MSPFVKYTVRFAVFILLQHLLLKQAPLWSFVTPYIYFLFILWLPFSMSRPTLMVLAAVYGLAMGYLALKPGIYAAVCVLLAYLRPFIISILLPREAAEMNFAEPSHRSMGLAPYAVYVVTLTLVHHGYLIFLEWLQVGHFWFFLKKILATTVVSMALIAVAEIFVVRKQKTRSSLNAG
jgi:hypothetical protein